MISENLYPLVDNCRVKASQEITFDPNREQGFTLVEIIIVIAIFGILATMSYLGLQSILPGYRLNGAINAVRGDLNNAKMLAAKRNRQYRVVFSTNSYELQRGDASSGSTVWTADLQRDFSDYSGVTVDTGATSNPVFSPRGTVSNVTITLQNADDTKTITISVAGRIRAN